MQLTILGCSGGIGIGVHTTCLRLDDDILIDAGTGLGDLNLDEMGRIRHIFLTHSHLDHICGIPLMVDSVFERLLGNPVVVHGRSETLQAFRDHIFNWVIWPDFSILPNTEQPVLLFETMNPGDTVEIDGRKLEMIEVNHVVPAVGYRVEQAGKSFVFSGDTTTNDNLWDTLNQRDVPEFMIVECAFGNRELELSRKAYHYCPSLLAADLRKLQRPPKIYITHLKPGAEDLIMGEIQELLPDMEIVRLMGGERLKL